MEYQHDRDIDVEGSFNVADLDKHLNALCLRAERRVSRPSFDVEGRDVLVEYVPLFAQTHRSIRVLGRKTYDRDGAAGDAASLAREQVEKVFAMALFIEDLPRWSGRLLVDGWARTYEAFLRDGEELGRVPRTAVYYTGEGVEEMERLRVVNGAPPELKEYMDLRAAGKNTNHVKGHKPSEYRFPTPSLAIKEVQDPARKACLQRWYSEYETSCSFSHALLQKVALSAIQRDGRDETIGLRVRALDRHAEHSLILSYTATAYALTDLNGFLGYDIETLVAAEGMWAVLRDASFVGRAVWDLHARHLMPGSTTFLRT